MVKTQTDNTIDNVNGCLITVVGWCLFWYIAVFIFLKWNLYSAEITKGFLNTEEKAYAWILSPLTGPIYCFIWLSDYAINLIKDMF